MSITNMIVAQVRESQQKLPDREGGVLAERARVVAALHKAIELEHADLCMLNIKGLEGARFPSLEAIKRPFGLSFDLGMDSVQLQVVERGRAGSYRDAGCSVDLVVLEGDRRLDVYSSGHVMTSRDGVKICAARHLGVPGAGEWMDLHPELEWRNAPGGAPAGKAPSMDELLRGALQLVIERADVMDAVAEGSLVERERVRA